MINLDEIQSEVFNELNANYTYSGDKPDSKNIYANNCLDEMINFIKSNFSAFTPKTSIILKTDSKEVKKEKRKNQKNIEQKAKENVYNNTPRPKPSGFLATITLGMLATWVLQAIVGWVVSRCLTKIYSEEAPEQIELEYNTRII